jgi:hypothetical protein
MGSGVCCGRRETVEPYGGGWPTFTHFVKVEA